MLMEHNPRSFLTGDDPFLPFRTVEDSADGFCAELVFEHRHEGFVGIPHGGLAMGLCLDAWRKSGISPYPVHAKFKFGGSGILIGDTANFSVEFPRDRRPRMLARITKNGDKTPYLKAELGPAALNDIPAWLPQLPGNDFRQLPYYRNCFVCGHHRTVTGLQRRFRVHVSDEDRIITTPWGLDPDDVDRAQYFLIGREELHPTVLISVFDENTAWAGFMDTRAAGLSVRLEFTLLRPVGSHEKLLFIGRSAGVRGNPRAPRFFLAEGAIVAVNGSGTPEPVAFGRGEWIIMDLYTSQIKEHLLPREDWAWIFSREEV
jgi:hypothetical protein